MTLFESFILFLIKRRKVFDENSKKKIKNNSQKKLQIFLIECLKNVEKFGQINNYLRQIMNILKPKNPNLHE